MSLALVSRAALPLVLRRLDDHGCAASGGASAEVADGQVMLCQVRNMDYGASDGGRSRERGRESASARAPTSPREVTSACARFGRGYWAVQPPSSTSTVPVIMREAGEAR